MEAGTPAGLRPELAESGYVLAVERALRTEGPAGVTPPQLRMWQQWRLRRGLGVSL